MIEFVNTNSAEPYVRLRKIYKKALNSNQKAIEAISISSYSNKAKSVDSRFVNLKIVDNTDFIFFSNYNSPKAEQFQDSNKIAALIFWNEINVQIIELYIIIDIRHTNIVIIIVKKLSIINPYLPISKIL